MSSDFTYNEQETAHLSALGLKEATCPEPHYSKGASYLVDALNRSCCRTRRNLPPLKHDLHDILNSLLGKDNLEYELDGNSRLMGLLSCSPPARTNNPLVYDTKFVHQNLSTDPAFGNPFADINHFSGVMAPCHETSKDKPSIRIEGFAYENSGSR